LRRYACKAKGIFVISKGDRFEELRKHKRTDVLSCAIGEFLNYNVLPHDQLLSKMVTVLAPRTFVNDDMLWYVLPKAIKDKAVFFTPRSMVNTIITNAHGKPLTGHWGIKRTVEQILSLHYLPTLSKDVDTHIKHCNPCQRAKRPPKNAMLTP
jgi:hypothetical protein